ncbi:MAG TPA: DNA cytosine methyltransferase [Rhizomicrobium sp.]|jgi:site-specific DNA-cytosine methylase
MANRYLLRKPTQAGSQFTAVDLFCGAGGISLGLSNAGFDVLFCSDRDRACAVTHRHNFPSIPFDEIPIEHLDARRIMSVTLNLLPHPRRQLRRPLRAESTEPLQAV